MKKSDLKKIDIRKAFIIKVLEYYWNSDSVDNVGNLFENYGQFVEKTCPKINPYEEWSYTDDDNSKVDMYEVTAQSRKCVFSFTTYYDGCSYTPKIYETYEELTIDNDWVKDYENVDKLKPRHNYNEYDIEDYRIWRDKYGRWIVQEYNSGIYECPYKIELLADMTFDRPSGFYIDYKEVPKEWIKGVGFCYDLGTAHNAVIDTIRECQANASREEFLDYDKEKFEEDDQKSLNGREEEYDPTAGGQQELNFESLKRLFKNMI